jgi:CubicO group peptidase (beta-lactamase class C family)
LGIKTIAAGLALLASMPGAGMARPAETKISAYVASAMAQNGANGLAIAIIENGKPVYVNTWGRRNVKGEPLSRDTVMYGASLTKAVFAYTVMQLVDEGKLDLDRPIERYLPRPLPDYANDEERYAGWHNLKGDERWRRITPRMLLTHSSGFSNFGFLEPDGKLRFHFEPGSRYAYSGDGIILLQFVIERGLGLDLGDEMQRRVFDRFKMTTTSMIWRADFAKNLADGWKADGSLEPHDERSKTRAAGSMDTTIADFSRFAGAYMRGVGLSKGSRAALTSPQLAITTASQFPSLQAELPPERRRKDLAAGLGVITFVGPQGRGFFKGGHNDSTGNMWVCVERGKRCVVMLSNDVRAESMFVGVVKLILGETGMPWDWEYGSPN